MKTVPKGVKFRKGITLDPHKIDSKKKERLQFLRKAFETAGYKIRAEDLKRGIGWKVVSGVCRAVNDKIVFVDKRLPVTEQIAFLEIKTKELSIDLNLEE
jgi:hypothetical protein